MISSPDTQARPRPNELGDMARKPDTIAAQVRRARLSRPEETLALNIRLYRLPAAVREYRFAPPRRWRLDFAWPELRVAVEVEGGLWGRGRHVRPAGFAADCEKYNALVLANWRVLRFTPEMIYAGRAVRLLEALLRPPAVQAGTQMAPRGRKTPPAALTWQERVFPEPRTSRNDASAD